MSTIRVSPCHDGFAPLETATYNELVRRFNSTTDPETRLRYQIVLLAHQGLTNAQIAPAVLRSRDTPAVLRSRDTVERVRNRDTVERVRNRFGTGGLDAVPYKKPGRSEPKVTLAWKQELERVVELDPHAVGVPSANWTTQLLADYLQDAVQFALHPTLTWVWCRKGRRGQRLVAAPDNNAKVYGFGLVDWRDGWFDGTFAPKRSAAPFCLQVERAIARSQARGRITIVIADNLGTHTPARSTSVRTLVSQQAQRLRQDLFGIFLDRLL